MGHSHKYSKKRITKSFFTINKAKHVLNKKHLTILYYSLVHSYLTYGIILWGSAKDTHVSKLIITQKKITGAPNDAHSEPLFKLLNILKLIDLYKLYISKYMFSFINNLLPCPILKLFTLTQDTHDHGTQHSKVENKIRGLRCLIIHLSMIHTPMNTK